MGFLEDWSWTWPPARRHLRTSRAIGVGGLSLSLALSLFRLSLSVCLSGSRCVAAFPEHFLPSVPPSALDLTIGQKDPRGRTHVWDLFTVSPGASLVNSLSILDSLTGGGFRPKVQWLRHQFANLALFSSLASTDTAAIVP